MTRLIENAVILTAREAAMLWQAARLSDLRVRARTNPSLYALLVDIYRAALTSKPSTTGTKQPVKREIPETDSSGFLTVTEVAKKVGVTPRTVRNDIHKELINAHRVGREWVFTLDAADAYIASRKQI